MDNSFYNNIIIVPVISFIVTVLIKWILIRIKSGKVDINKSLWSWWMPSVHSSVVVSLVTAIALKNSLNSDLFAIAMTFTVIIIYDAINVRFEAWLHASAINKSIWEKRFKESLWHLPSEAFAWSLIGIGVALVLYFF